MTRMQVFLLLGALCVALSTAFIGNDAKSEPALTRSSSEDPITSFQALHPVDGATTMCPVEFKYEIGIKSLEGYQVHYGDKFLCVWLTGGRTECSPLSDPNIVFEDLPAGNYTAQAYITDNKKILRYHEAPEARLLVISRAELNKSEDAEVSGEIELVEWAEQQESMQQDFTSPAAVNDSDPFVVIGVKTAVVANFAFRQAIRETWANQTVLPRDVKVFFVGCEPRLDHFYDAGERERIKRAIELEKRIYGNLLTDELDCEDLRDDLTTKMKEFLHFATQMFSQTPFVMIGNDDIYLRADHLVRRLLEGQRPKHLYMGYVCDKTLSCSTSPVRDPMLPNYLSKSIYPMSSLLSFACGAHYLISMDCARFISKNRRQLRGLGGIVDASVALWLSSMQVHVEHTPTFVHLGFQACEDSTISLADLSPFAIRLIHSNLCEHRKLCQGFNKNTWQKVIPLLSDSPLKITTNVHDIKSLGVLQVTSTLSAPGKSSVTMAYNPSAETLSAYSQRVCEQARSLAGSVNCRELTEQLRVQQQKEFQNIMASGEIAPSFLELWRHNLFATDLYAAAVIVAYSKMAKYSAAVLECLFATVFEHTKRPILVVPEDILRQHYQNIPDVFVFSILGSDCSLSITNIECRQMIAGYVREYLTMNKYTPTRATKLMMIAGEPTDTSELDNRVLLVSTVSNLLRKLHAYLPVASSSFGERLNHTPMDLLIPAYTVSEENQERRFCAYLYARCDRPQREYMFDKLNAMEYVDALGVCAGSSRPRDESYKASRFSFWYNDDAVTMFRQYKFVIAFENSGVPGYVTEKLINPFLAGSIPIYFGNSTTAAQLFNPESFIDCGRFAKLADCAAYVMRIHNSPESYARMRRAAPIRNITAFNEVFSWHPSVPSRALADKVAKMLQFGV